ncbi:65-kDa microtubule-associated protein 3-like isoform X1 [Musa acuminata AAA Group]|uniref:65-kDa microtubule-associated protein 3-like isoform X1 n=2 Tax=Musa acuminata AAA Group TaxID=214697 RepID=UPI0031E406DC
MARNPNDPLPQVETTCESLLDELQVIWDELGESDAEKDKMLLELEQECLNVYRRKVDQANLYRAQLQQQIADSEAEIVAICSSMGERPVHIRQSPGFLKEQLKATALKLEEMHKRKSERLNQFLEVLDQIQKISTEICPTEYDPSKFAIDGSDLSVRILEDLQTQLQSLQKEKSERLRQVMDHLNTLKKLCLVVGIDFKETIREVQPGLDQDEGSKNISNNTIESLASAIENMRKIKIKRMQKLQDLVTAMLELWNLMDTPNEEQQQFQKVTCNIAASEQEFTEPNALSMDFINYVEAEVLRLEQLKASKLKELVLRKKTELEEIRRRTHLVAEADYEPEFSIDAVEAGATDASLVLEHIEAQISTAKEEAFSRKDILERVEKWLAACEEEAWLEEYNRDENRYSAGRGAHLTLKRAEKARALVSKIPAMVDTLENKVTAWEKERGTEFIYDGAPLLSMLEQYITVSQEKEQERKRQRDQKKLQGQLTAEKEVLYGSKPSPAKLQSFKKTHKTLTLSPSQRISLGAAATNSPKKAYEVGTVSTGTRGIDNAGLSEKSSSNATATATFETSSPSEDVKETTKAMPVSTPKSPRKVAADGTGEGDATEYSFEERRLVFCLSRKRDEGAL